MVFGGGPAFLLHPAFNHFGREELRAKRRYKGQVSLALSSQLCPLPTVVVCYKGQTLLQLDARMNQRQAGQ